MDIRAWIATKLFEMALTVEETTVINHMEEMLSDMDWGYCPDCQGSGEPRYCR
jgi:hypothetical protein